MISGDALERLREALGVEPSSLVQAELPRRLSLTGTVDGDHVARLTHATLDAAVTAYGRALSLTISTGDLPELEVVDGAYSHAQLTALTGAAEPGHTYGIVLQIDKARLSEAMTGPPAHGSLLLFFQHEAFCAALRRGLASLGSELWPDSSRRLVVAVLDREVAVVGPLLSVVGGNSLNRLADELARTPATSADLAWVSKRRDDYIGWDADLETAFTPWHFALDDVDGDSDLVALLDSIGVLLAMLYTCDRARVVRRTAGAPGVRLEFRGREHAAFVPRDQSAPLDRMTPEHRHALRRLVDWCYHADIDGDVRTDRIGDRLLFVQTRVAQSLEPRPEEARFEAFALEMPQIFEGVQWHWRAFVQDKVTQYLDEVEKLEGTVGSAVDSYTSKVTSLVKGVTDTMLAAVAVLVGTFIAAAFADPFNEDLFRIGVITYGAYVALFPALIGLLVDWGNARQVEEAFDSQRRQFNDALYADKVDDIVGERVHTARRRYERWFWVTAAGYVVVILGALVAAAAVPDAVSGESDRAPGSTTTTTIP